MFYTEEEARMKWCPMVRYDGDDGGTFNRGVIDPLNKRKDGSYVCNCIASECMWWKQSLDGERGCCGVIK